MATEKQLKGLWARGKKLDVSQASKVITFMDESFPDELELNTPAQDNSDEDTIYDESHNNDYWEEERNKEVEDYLLSQEEEEEEEKVETFRSNDPNFEKHFKYGSTTVMHHNGEFFFKGDIIRCGRNKIFHNAKTIKKLMIEKQKKFGHMNYNDWPTFSEKFDWFKEEEERKQIYKESLYQFKGDEIVLVERLVPVEKEEEFVGKGEHDD